MNSGAVLMSRSDIEAEIREIVNQMKQLEKKE